MRKQSSIWMSWVQTWRAYIRLIFSHVIIMTAHQNGTVYLLDGTLNVKGHPNTVRTKSFIHYSRFTIYDFYKLNWSNICLFLWNEEAMTNLACVDIKKQYTHEIEELFPTITFKWVHNSSTRMILFAFCFLFFCIYFFWISFCLFRVISIVLLIAHS